MFRSGGTRRVWRGRVTPRWQEPGETPPESGSKRSRTAVDVSIASVKRVIAKYQTATNQAAMLLKNIEGMPQWEWARTPAMTKNITDSQRKLEDAGTHHMEFSCLLGAAVWPKGVDFFVEILLKFGC